MLWGTWEYWNTGDKIGNNYFNLAPTCRGTFLTGLTRLTRPPRLSESDGGQARFFYFLYIPSTSSGPEPVEGLNIPYIPGPDLACKD